MAKLKHAGQELVRAVKVEEGSGDVEWRKTILTLHSTGHILRKQQVRFRETSHESAKNHDWGWERWRRAKAGAETSRIARIFEAWGFEIVFENVVVEKVRI